MANKEINNNIYLSGDDLSQWFNIMLKKYPNSKTREHLIAIQAMMNGDTIQDDSLQTFLKNINNN